MIPSNLPIFINDSSSSSSSGLRRSGDRYNPFTLEDYRPPQRRRTHRSGGSHHPISLTDDDTPIIIIPDSPDRSDLSSASAPAPAPASASASESASAPAPAAPAASASASAPAVPAAFASAFTSAASASPATDSKGKRPIAPDPDAHCNICMYDKYSHQLFTNHSCSHRYCTSCISQYVTAKVEDNVASIRCPDPGCETGVLDLEMCRGILPPAVFERWGMALCEMLIGPMKLYFPYKDCSALLIDDGGEDDRSARAPASASASAPAPAASAFTSASPAADSKGKRPIAPDPDAHCNICMDDKYSHQLFTNHSCSHRYCTSCISQYVTTKVEDNVASIRCPDPGCKTGVLDPEMCRGILPPAVFERWGMVLCEMLIGPMKLYCPYKDCSALLIDDGGEDGVVVTDAECPHCFRWFCVKCKVPWHTDFTCEQFQVLGEDSRGDDLMLMGVAKAEKWQRCPACSYYVEKTGGCLFVMCRCGTSFCYKCGKETVIPHFCVNCSPNLIRPLQLEQYLPYGQMPQMPPPRIPPHLLPQTSPLMQLPQLPQRPQQEQHGGLLTFEQELEVYVREFERHLEMGDY